MFPPDSPSTPATAGTGRKVWVAGKPVPAFASATRRKHMSELASSRKYVWRYAITCGVLFLAAAATRNPIVAGVALVVGVAIVTFQLVRDATSHAHRDFFAGFALKHGLTYSDKMTLAPATPLLSAGDRRYCEHYMEGPLRGSNHLAALSHFVYETREQRRDRRNRAITVYTPHAFTICVIDLPRSTTSFPAVYLTKKPRVGKTDWYDAPGLQTIEFDGALQTNRYRLMTINSQDRPRLRELLQPSFQSWLTELDRQVNFEFVGGTLVVYVPGKLRDSEALESMMVATERIAAQFMRLNEPLQLVGPSVPPPGPGRAMVHGDFPPPPPATKPQISVVPDEPVRSRMGSTSVPPPGV